MDNNTQLFREKLIDIFNNSDNYDYKGVPRTDVMIKQILEEYIPEVQAPTFHSVKGVEGLAERSSELQEGTYTPQHKVTYQHGFIDGYKAAQSSPIVKDVEGMIKKWETYAEYEDPNIRQVAEEVVKDLKELAAQSAPMDESKNVDDLINWEQEFISLRSYIDGLEHYFTTGVKDAGHYQIALSDKLTILEKRVRELSSQSSPMDETKTTVSLHDGKDVNYNLRGQLISFHEWLQKHSEHGYFISQFIIDKYLETVIEEANTKQVKETAEQILHKYILEVSPFETATVGNTKVKIATVRAMEAYAEQYK